MSHIKLHGIKPRIQYVANGTLTEYEFPFVIFSSADIKVYLNDVLQDTTTYTVSGIKNTNGGCVIFLTPPEMDTTITIIRDLSIERTTDFQEGGALRADTLNDEFDYQTACLQQVADNINRSMILPPYATNTEVDLTLPTPLAGCAIVWNEQGTNLENSVVRVNDLENTLKQYKEVSENAASIAIEQAKIASDKSDNATEQAQIATQKATEASHTLASKANADMDNLTQIGKEAIVCLGVPDYTRGVSVPINTSFIPPTDGLIEYKVYCGTASGSPFWIHETDVSGRKLAGLGNAASGYIHMGGQLVVLKDKVYYIESKATIEHLTFYPYKGA